MGYYEEKQRYNELENKKQNICPKCKKGFLETVREIKQKLRFSKRKVVFASFCPVCGHTIRKEVEL